jgi:hypothetical protein
VTAAVRGLGARQLDSKPGDLSVRETVHHLVEAHVVASSIVIAALGGPGCTYDWSWMQPFGPWIGRLGYGTMPIRPSLAALRALNRFVGTVVKRLPDGLDREVLLREEPGVRPHRATVADVLRQEVEQVADHLRPLRGLRRRIRKGNP